MLALLTSNSILFPLAWKRVIRKVRKRQHQNPEFGHKQGEIHKKRTAKKSTLAFKRGRETQKTIKFFNGYLSFRATPLLLHIFSLLLPGQLL
jgi:hypothetical protein